MQRYGRGGEGEEKGQQYQLYRSGERYTGVDHGCRIAGLVILKGS